MVHNLVFVPYINAVEAIEMVKELRTKGLVQGLDFEFAFHHARYQLGDEGHVIPKGVEFKFRDAKWVTFFRMKYDGAN